MREPATLEPALAPRPDERFGFDAYAPREIAQRVEDIGVAKARMPLATMALLGMLAGAFIGLGMLFNLLVASDASLGFAASRLLGGLVFSLGLLLVVVAGAELFTGNNLLAMAYADGRITLFELLRNWGVVCAANLVGAAGLALLVFLSGHAQMNGGRVALKVLELAAAKATLSPTEAFFKGVLCNVLVCMAVWMSLAARSVVDKAVAVVPPVAAFVAAGFEHSIANMYLFPLALLLKAQGVVAIDPAIDSTIASAVTWAGFGHNLLWVIPGNLVGGSVLVGLVYHFIYRRKP